jgi:hypothetical protein
MIGGEEQKSNGEEKSDLLLAQGKKRNKNEGQRMTTVVITFHWSFGRFLIPKDDSYAKFQLRVRSPSVSALTSAGKQWLWLTLLAI